MADTIRCGVIGYGRLFNRGKWHGIKIQAVEGLELTAIFSRSQERRDAASADFPSVEIFDDIPTMLERAEMDLAVIVTPHYTHAPIAIECFRARKHAIVDKAMCRTVAEADEMIEEANEADRSLAVFHNRRRDGNVRAIKRAIDDGLIGDVYHVECTAFGYGKPGPTWYADKRMSGGALYMWGPHAVDWVLHMIPHKVIGVTGFSHDLVWHDVTNEDHARAVMHFGNGAVAEVSTSTIARAGKPLWYILGSKGAIVDTGDDSLAGYFFEPVGHSSGTFRMVTERDGQVIEEDVPYMPSDWIRFYEMIADHLLHGAPLPVTGEDGRRVVAVLEAAARSADSRHTEGVPHE